MAVDVLVMELLYLHNLVLLMVVLVVTVKPMRAEVGLEVPVVEQVIVTGKH